MTILTAQNVLKNLELTWVEEELGRAINGFLSGKDFCIMDLIYL